MVDWERYVAAMGSLALNARSDLAREAVDLFWTMLADLDDETFHRAVFLWIRHNKFFPSVSELREKVTPYVSVQAEAGHAFEEVCKIGTYTPTGTRWQIATVAALVGPCAAEAFAACGGSRAFEAEQGERDLPYLRKRFLEAFIGAAEAQRQGRDLQPASSKTALPSASPLRGLVTSTAARLAWPRKDAVR